MLVRAEPDHLHLRLLGGSCIDPCAGMACNTPPATTCANSSTLRTYAAQGTCTAGTCAYGHTDTACPAPLNGIASCENGVCDFTCVAGYHRCQTQCLSSTSLNSCGSSCVPCPTPAAPLYSICDNGTCQVVQPWIGSPCGAGVSSVDPYVECADPGYCDYETKVCDCGEQYYYGQEHNCSNGCCGYCDWNSEICKGGLPGGSHCGYDAQCKSYDCSGGVCVCAGYGSFCTDDYVCCSGTCKSMMCQ